MVLRVTRAYRASLLPAGPGRRRVRRARWATSTGRATDEWTRSYPLAPGGRGPDRQHQRQIEIEGVDGSDGGGPRRADCPGATDAAARELLPRIDIKEDIKPDRVSIETERLSGIMIGAAFEVRYHVRAPKNAVVNVSNTNGLVAVSGADRQGRGPYDQRRRHRQRPHRRRRRALDQRRRRHRLGVGRHGPHRAAHHQRRRHAHAPRRRRPTSRRRAPTAASASRGVKLEVSRTVAASPRRPAERRRHADRTADDQWRHAAPPNEEEKPERDLGTGRQNLEPCLRP